ncbi:hypothetical protein N9902_02870 [Akkermansiaceae bacterium]|nr:hypothetical protein [Akkermansiaceae bacterium]MDB4816947.1 hypothetical protein [bacterium]MDB4041444.1 hypothetical protein [Akkermansiaceae bacterium]MDB4301781.1 hypothetical protein [Akkermansiaceae bacterium]MDB4305084.1 hypothetical protein [Akkermansiaceae bacterium]
MKKDFSNAARILTTKKESWSYENEWRIVGNLHEANILPSDNKKFYTLPAEREQIAEVVFGPSAKPDFIGRMTDWLGEEHATIHKLTIDSGSRNLVLGPVMRNS